MLYNLLITLTAIGWVPWMLWRSRKRKEQPNWKERCGDFQIQIDPKRPRVWVHAVSVGEVVASLPILAALKRLKPEIEIVLSVTTSSGHQTARERALEFVDHIVYFPIDVARFQLAAMTRARPHAVAVMETELWFNFLWASKSIRAQTLLVNGRISDRSFPRSMRIRFFYRALLGFLDRALMQTDLDAERIAALGANSVEVMGNCKFDQAAEGVVGDPQHWRDELKLESSKPVLVIGSTRGKEEEAFVHRALQIVGSEKVQVIHAPRHLERADELASSAQAAFGSVARRSRGETGPYLVLDTYGELTQVYAAADIVVIGGGFENHGGQNLIQPLAHGKPVLHGPHMQNFAEAARAAQKAECSRTCATPEELAAAIDELIRDPKLRAAMGQSAKELVQRSLGASERYAQAILDGVAQAYASGRR